MPMRAPTPCLRPGCPAMVEGRYCPEHTPAKDRMYDTTSRGADPALARAAQLRSSARWQKIRIASRQRWPICCDPFMEGCERATQQINHIQRLETHPELAFVESNHAPLCTGCHAQVSAIERRGGNAPALFTDWQLKYAQKFGKKGAFLHLRM